MDADASARVQELTKEVIEKFSQEFAKAYTESLIDKIKEEVNGEEESGFQLESAPIPTEPLKTGKLTKQGGFIRNWKERHFIAYNEADNFKVDYLDKENGKVRGYIAPCGYRAEPFDEEDTKKMGDFGIKLVGDARRRVWYLKASSKEERDEWLEVLKLSCYKAKPQRNKDPVIADAFDIAYWRVRWWYCLWGSYQPYGTEDERLAGLLVSILDREVLWDVISKLPSGVARGALESAIRNPVEASVSAAVGGSWTGSVSAVSGLRGTLESSVRQLISPLLEQEKKLKSQIIETISGVINPVIADKGANLLRPVLLKACSPIGKAFTLGANGFLEKVQEMIKENEFEASKFAEGVKKLDRNYYWILYKGYDVVWDLCFNAFAEIAASFANGISYWEVYYMSKDAMNDIFHNAVYTFQKLSSDADPKSHGTILLEVMKKYAHDSKLAAKQLIVKILRALLDTPVQELIIKPSLTLVAPIQGVIDSIPIPGLSSLFNLTALTSDAAEEIIQNALNTLVEHGFIDSLNSEFTAIKLN